MGATFRYIDDAVLPFYTETNESCHLCESEASVFPFMIDGDPPYDDSEFVCLNCIRTAPLRVICPKDNERQITNIINQHYPKGTKTQDQRFALTVEICDEYRRTPSLPNFIQNDDWPHCCGDFTEFIGDAGRSYPGPFDGFEWWGYEFDGCVEHGIEGMLAGEDRVSLFRCLTCVKKFWTCQVT